MPTRRAFLRLALVALAAVLVTGCLNPDQQSVFDLVNESRTARGIAPLAEHEVATDKAQAWAEYLATQGGELSHSDPYAGLDEVDWQMFAENVGWADGTAADVHAGYLGSKGHAANIFNPKYTHLGVGHAVRDGRVYTVHVFLRIP